MAEENKSRITVGPGRFSYTHVFKPYAGKNGDQEPKYQVSFLISKKDKKTIAKVEAAIEEAKKKGKTTKWNGKVPGKLDISFRDGDTERPDDPNYAGMMYITAKSSRKPTLFDRNQNEIIDQDEFYSGCVGFLMCDFFPYSGQQNGIAAGLQACVKTKDDEPFGAAKPTVDAVFADLDLDDDDDDL